MIINFSPKHGAEYHGIEQSFRFPYGYGEIAAEYILLTLSHGHPLDIALSQVQSLNVDLSHGHPLNITLSQEVA